jgi:prepilin-type processing-associated H-X9-DG protein
MMRKAGLSKVLLLGNSQMATAEAYLARDGTPHLGYLVNITYADGHHYQFASDK